MDLIYTDANMNDVGVLKGYSLDMEDGESRHDFQLKLSKREFSKLEQGSYIYIDDGSGLYRFGGRADDVKLDSENELVTIIGPTWIGLLDNWVWYLHEYDRLESRPQYFDYGKPSMIFNQGVLSSGAYQVFEGENNADVDTYEKNWTIDLPLTVLETYNKYFSGYGLSCRYDPTCKKIRTKLTNRKNVTVDLANPNIRSVAIEKKLLPVNHIISVGRVTPQYYATSHLMVRSKDAATRPGEYDILTESEYDSLHGNYGDYFSPYSEVVKHIHNPNTDVPGSAFDALYRETIQEASSISSIGEVGADLNDSITCVDTETQTSMTKVITNRIVKMTETYFDVVYS